jgi:hypothetical protein
MGGISPAATTMQAWKLLPLRHISEAATAPSRWNVRRQQGIERWKQARNQNIISEQPYK